MVSKVVVARNTSTTTTVALGSLSGSISCRVIKTRSLFKRAHQPLPCPKNTYPILLTTLQSLRPCRVTAARMGFCIIHMCEASLVEAQSAPPRPFMCIRPLMRVRRNCLSRGPDIYLGLAGESRCVKEAKSCDARTSARGKTSARAGRAPERRAGPPGRGGGSCRTGRRYRIGDGHRRHTRAGQYHTGATARALREPAMFSLSPLRVYI